MINTYCQTTEITESGYKIIVSKNNSLSDDELVAIFQNSEITKSSDSELRVFSNGIALVKSGVQQDTGRTSQNILLINGIDSAKINAEDLQKLKNLMTNFFNNEYLNIKEEYKKSNSSSRKIIIISAFMSDFENNILLQKLPEIETDLKKKNNKSYNKYFFAGCIFIIIIALLIGQSVVAGVMKKFKGGFKKVKEEITKVVSKKEKIPLKKQICDELNFTDDEFEKAKNIEPNVSKRLLDEAEYDKISNSIKEKSLIFFFCLPKEASNIKNFYNIENVDYNKVLNIRKNNIKLIEFLNDYYKKINDIKIKDIYFDIKTLDLDNKKYASVHPYLKHLKDYYSRLQKSYLDFSDYSDYKNIAFPIFSKKDSKIIDKMKDFFCDDSFSYGYWLNESDKWKEISNINDLKNCLKNMDLQNILDLKEKILHRDGDEEAVEKISIYIDLLVNSKSELLQLVKGEE